MIKDMLSFVVQIASLLDLESTNIHGSTGRAKLSDGRCETCFDRLRNDSALENGVYSLRLWDSVKKGHVVIDALCDMTGGGYTVVHQRCLRMLDGSVPFNRTWAEYAAGFGTVSVSGSFWWGLDNLHLLSHCAPNNARFTLTGPECNVDRGYLAGTFHADYANFTVGSAAAKYRMDYANYIGDNFTGDAHNRDGLCLYGQGDRFCPRGMSFSTWDNDNDKASGSCSQFNGRAGWWWNSCGRAWLTAPYKDGCSSINGWYPAIFSISSSSLSLRPSAAESPP